MTWKNCNRIIISLVTILLYAAALPALVTGCKKIDERAKESKQVEKESLERKQPQEKKQVSKGEEKVAVKRPRLTVGLCRILGMLNEYMGRFNYITGQPHAGYVESFYLNEQEIADRFEEMILAYTEESGERFPLRRDPPGSGLVFESDKFSKMINSLYVVDEEEFRGGTLDRDLLYKASEKCRLAYLEGAYLRFGEKGANAISMANGYTKIVTLAHLLEGFGCKQVRIYKFEAFPTSYMTVFTPSEEIKNLLPISRELSEEEMKGYEEVKK